MTTLLKSPRPIMLRGWMREQDPRVTVRELADVLGLTERRMSQLLNGDTARPEHVLKLVEVGVPEDLLPRPEYLKPGPKPRGVCAAPAASDSSGASGVAGAA